MNFFSSSSPSPKLSKNSPSECVLVPYRECRKKSNKKCEWVYGSVKGVKTGVRKRHCRTRKNKSRSK